MTYEQEINVRTFRQWLNAGFVLPSVFCDTIYLRNHSYGWAFLQIIVTIFFIVSATTANIERERLRERLLARKHKNKFDKLP